ncbi:hypothetical protein SAMN05877842_10929 [Ureibacillus acetophenoni]|uniref:Uncharacterized protein n=1 Tax=Ureibacillus acetophenoni TaxID=614649 RepID=A0A285UGX1_9BACL|nr:hypothetical protein SAMN05877842_10929 [Ureibacillus acetophenoni]
MGDFRNLSGKFPSIVKFPVKKANISESFILCGISIYLWSQNFTHRMNKGRIYPYLVKSPKNRLNRGRNYPYLLKKGLNEVTFLK